MVMNSQAKSQINDAANSSAMDGWMHGRGEAHTVE